MDMASTVVNTVPNFVQMHAKIKVISNVENMKCTANAYLKINLFVVLVLQNFVVV